MQRRSTPAAAACANHAARRPAAPRRRPVQLPRGLAAAEEAWLLRHKPQVIAVAITAGGGNRQGALSMPSPAEGRQGRYLQGQWRASATGLPAPPQHHRSPSPRRPATGAPIISAQEIDCTPGRPVRDRCVARYPWPRFPPWLRRGHYEATGTRRVRRRSGPPSICSEPALNSTLPSGLCTSGSPITPAASPMSAGGRSRLVPTDGGSWRSHRWLPLLGGRCSMRRARACRRCRICAP